MPSAFMGLAAVLNLLPSTGGGSPGLPAQAIAATFAASGIVALVGRMGRHVSWIAFFAVAVLAWRS